MKVDALHPPFEHISLRRDQQIIPVFVIAAAVNARSRLDVPAVRVGCDEHGARVEFSLDADGELMQQYYWREQPNTGADDAAVRRGIKSLRIGSFSRNAWTFGPLTPSAFRLTERLDGRPRRLVATSTESDRARLQLLHDAFNVYRLVAALNIYLVAYTKGLI